MNQVERGLCLTVAVVFTSLAPAMCWAACDRISHSALLEYSPPAPDFPQNLDACLRKWRGSGIQINGCYNDAIQREEVSLASAYCAHPKALASNTAWASARDRKCVGDGDMQCLLAETHERRLWVESLH
jgi:hypothetical protein